MREICGEYFRLSARHCSCSPSAWKRNETPAFILPPNSTDLNRLITTIWEKCSSGSRSLWRRWTEASFKAKRHWRSWWVAQMSLRVNLCEKKIFWIFNLTAIMHVLFCTSCLLILWTLSKCYCVKYSRISPISLFYISQGSAATHIRCGGQRGIGFVANFLENTTVKEFWKSADIYASYEPMYSDTDFLTHCVYLPLRKGWNMWQLLLT